MKTKHNTAFGLALEAAQNAELALNDKDLEFFACIVIDGEEVSAELGGNINEQVIAGLEHLLSELKTKNNTTALYTYQNAMIGERPSGLIG